MRRAAARLASGLSLVLGLAGCLSKPALTSQSFAIDPPPAAGGTRAADARILEVGTVDVAPTYAGRSLAYRNGAHLVERDPYARFAAPPGAMLREAIRGYLANADFVRDVTEPGAGVRADAKLEISASDLYGDLGGAEAAAVMTLRIRVLSPAGEAWPPEVLRKTYTSRVPVGRRTAEAVVDGWNRCLAGIMSEFLPDLRSALDGSGPK